MILSSMLVTVYMAMAGDILITKIILTYFCYEQKRGCVSVDPILAHSSDHGSCDVLSLIF